MGVLVCIEVVWVGARKGQLTGNFPDDQGAEQRVGAKEERRDELGEGMAAVEDVQGKTGCAEVHWRVWGRHGCRRRLDDVLGGGVEDALRLLELLLKLLELD
jgi:hypothetical protein